MVDHRAKYRLGLSALYLPRYDALCDILPEEWQPYFGLRTFAQQAALYAQGRAAPGGIVTWAEPGESAHEYGCATDWTLFDAVGKPIWMKRDDIRILPFVSIVQRVQGVRSGVAFKDPLHVELKLSCSWKDVLMAYNSGGTEAADEQIRLSMVL